MNTTDLEWMVIIGTLVLASFMGFVVLLMVMNTNRRIRHRAELAELRMQRDQEVMSAEREATRQTLHEVGRELHDNVAQLLTVAQLGLNNALDGAPPDPRLNASREALDQGIEEVRRLGHDLNTDMWQRRSLADAISATAERIERVGRLRAHVLVRGELPVLPGDTATILFRVFQEVVQNAVKHSGADTLSITLDVGPPLALTVSDNGRGFNVANTAGNNGLLNIRRRCALIGFSAECTSAPGTGCTWIFEQQNDHGRA